MNATYIYGQKALDKLCAKLRKNSDTLPNLRLPPHDVDGGDAYDGWETQLSQALTNSTVVAGLIIDLARVKRIDSIKFILPFLRTSQHLRKLSLTSRYEPIGVANDLYSELLRLVLDAASENEGIEELIFGNCEPFEGIGKVIQGAKPRALTFTAAMTATSLDNIGRALKTNPGLRALKMHRVDNIQFLLQHLGAHPTLENLSLGQLACRYRWETVDSQSLIPTLTSFVTATTSLLQLKLHGFSFSAAIECLVEALKVNQSVSTFAIWDSRMCPKAAGELSEFFQSGDAISNGIKHLELKVMPTYGIVEGERLVSFLGPSLDSLTFSNKRGSRILDYLRTNGVVNRMPSHWHVKDLSFTVAKVLATLLPQADKLTELDLSFVQRQGDRFSPVSAILPALKQNWNLTRVSFMLNNGEPYYKKDSNDLKKMRMYCARNASASAILSGADPSNGDESAVRALVVPSLFALMAVQATKSSIHGVFKGAFAMAAEAGSGHGGATKRARSDVASVASPVDDEPNPHHDTNVEPNKKRAAITDAQGKPFAQPTE